MRKVLGDAEGEEMTNSKPITPDDRILRPRFRGMDRLPEELQEMISDEIDAAIAAHDNTLYQRVVDEVIGPDVIPNMHPSLLQANQDAQNRLRKVQRTELARIFGKGE